MRAASRMWELPSWQSYYSLAPSDWPRLREVVRHALADGPLTLEELGSAITARSQFRHLRFVFDGNPWTFEGTRLAGRLELRARAGSHDVSAPRRQPSLGGHPRSRRGRDACGRGVLRRVWADNARSRPVLAGGRPGRGAQADPAWIAGFGDRLVAVDIEGVTGFVLASTEDLGATSPSASIRLLPTTTNGFSVPAQPTPVVPPGRRCAGHPRSQYRDRRRSRVRDVGSDGRPRRRRLVQGSRAGPIETARRGGTAARHDLGLAPSVSIQIT